MWAGVQDTDTVNNSRHVICDVFYQLIVMDPRVKKLCSSVRKNNDLIFALPLLSKHSLFHKGVTCLTAPYLILHIMSGTSSGCHTSSNPHAYCKAHHCLKICGCCKEYHPLMMSNTIRCKEAPVKACRKRVRLYYSFSSSRKSAYLIYTVLMVQV